MKRFGLGWFLILATTSTCFADTRPSTPAPASLPPALLPAPSTGSAAPPACPPLCCPPPTCKVVGPRIWGSVDYLLWGITEGNLPPLVTTGPPTDAFPGALDQPGTSILFGNGRLKYGAFSGLRATLGGWLSDDGPWGFEASAFLLERRSDGFRAQGNATGQPFLAAPFVNALTGNDNVYFISQNFADSARSAFLTGGVQSSSAVRLWSWEVNAAANLWRDLTWAADLLVGFRQVSLRDHLLYLTAATNLNADGGVSFLGDPVAPGFLVSTNDLFRAENLFNGVQVGARIDKRCGQRVLLGVYGKVALGTMHQRVTVSGETTTNAPLAVQQAIGGIYAQPTNIGVHSRDVFAVVPEGGVNLAVELCRHCRARIGYSFLYLNTVVRPGDQIDLTLNPNQVPIDSAYGTGNGPSRPSLALRSTGFWAQGMNFGLEFGF